MSKISRAILAFLILFLFFFLPRLTADVIYLNDGEILIGTVKQTTERGVIYDTFKGAVEVELGRILRTEATLDRLKTIPISIQLKDASVLRGTMVDFDPEVGVFLDIVFGTLTVPFEGIDRILEMDQVIRYHGHPFHVTAGGGMYMPILDSDRYFDPSWVSTASFQLSIPGIRGLYAGIQASYMGADFAKNTTTEYYFVSIGPELTFKYLDLRVREGFFQAFTPFATLFAGPCYINISDPNLYPTSYGELTLHVGTKLGTEIALFEHLSIEIAGVAGMLLQREHPYTLIGAVLRIGYDF